MSFWYHFGTISSIGAVVISAIGVVVISAIGALVISAIGAVVISAIGALVISAFGAIILTSAITSGLFGMVLNTAVLTRFVDFVFPETKSQVAKTII